MIRAIAGCAFLVVVCATFPPAPGQERAAADTDAGRLKIVVEVAQGQSRFGELAARKATDPALKKYAQNMVEESKAANKELKKLGEKMKLSLPTDLPAAREKELKGMGRLQGAIFDHAFLRGELDRHRDAIRQLEKQSLAGKNAELTDWAQKRLPTLRSNLKLANRLREQLPGGSAEPVRHPEAPERLKKPGG